MAIIRFDPFRTVDSLAKKMNQVMGEFDKGFDLEYGGFSPRIDISEDEQKLHITAELPGIEKSEVKLSINEEGLLSIKGEKKREFKEEKKEEEISFIRAERIYGSFTRTFLLPDYVNRESIKAVYNNGVLEVTFDKVEPQAPKETHITIE